MTQARELQRHYCGIHLGQAVCDGTRGQSVGLGMSIGNAGPKGKQVSERSGLSYYRSGVHHPDFDAASQAVQIAS